MFTKKKDIAKGKSAKRTILFGIISGAITLLLLLSVVVYVPWPQDTLEEVLENRILKPMPEHTKITELHYDNPSLGAGQLLVELVLTEYGLSQLFQLYNWKEVVPQEAHQLRSFEVLKDDDIRRIFTFRLSETTELEMVLDNGGSVIIAADGL